MTSKDTVKRAVSMARTVYRKKPGEVLDFLMLETVIRLMVLSPALFLLTDSLRPWALLTVPLFLLVVPFARERAAENMQDALSGGSLFSWNLVRMEGWAGSVWRGIKKGFFLMLWASPFLAATIWLYRVIFGSTVVGQTDVISVIMALSSLGGGDLVRGAMLAMVLYALTLLPFCFGLGFHSGSRHARALGMEKSIKGHRKTVLRCFARSLLTLVPFVLVSGWSVIGYLLRVVEAVNQLAGGLSIPAPDAGLYVVLGSFVLLLLPLIPLKSLMTAACVRVMNE